MSAGVDPQLIQECPLHEKVRNFLVGFLVFLLSVLSLISVTYSCTELFQLTTKDYNLGNVPSYLISIFIGAIWFLIVFNIYRACLTISGIGDGTSRITKDELLNSLPQVFLAVILALCLAAPLSLLILNKSTTKSIISIEDIDKIYNQQNDLTAFYYQKLIDFHTKNSNKSYQNDFEKNIYQTMMKKYQDLENQKSESFISKLQKVFRQHNTLCLLIFFISIFFYCLPIFLRLIWVKGVYEYKVEFQNKLMLETYGIYPNYYNVTFKSKVYRDDRFLIPERMIRSK